MKTFYARCCSTCKNGIFFLLRAAQLLFARKKVLHFAGKNWYSSGIAYPVQNHVTGKGDEPMRNVNLTRLKNIINHYDKYKEIAVPDGLRRPVRLKTGIFRELFEKNALPS